MQLKTYRAARMGAAMAAIRAELGDEALILSTRRVQDGVEVIAARDPDVPAASPVPPPPRPLELRVREKPQFAPPAHRLALLRGHGVPDGLMERLMTGPLADGLAAALPFAALPSGVMLLCGPPGAGKTLTVAKLATRMVLAGRTPCVITTDTARPAASEQLAAYTRLLGLRLMVARTPEALSRGMARREGDAPVLIDTAGFAPGDAAETAALAALIAASGAAPIAVLPAGMDAAEAAETGQALHALGARALVATRLDIARRLGGIFAAAASGLAMTDAGIAADAASGLVAATPAFIAERLMRGHARETA